jgi:hypothetical protein
VLMLQGIYHCSGAFSFSVILFFLLCASVLPLGHYVVAEAGCNWYHLDINIYFLSKKNRLSPPMSIMYLSEYDPTHEMALVTS